MIGIIDNKLGNLRSVENAFQYLEIEHEIFSDPKEIKKYSKLVLPGVGAFGVAMENLHSSGFYDGIINQTKNKDVPLLGICLGMQLLFENSTEYGNHSGLGLIKGRVEYIGDKVEKLSIPHMGWNSLIANKDSYLLKDIDLQEQSFYFVHNYYCFAENREESVAMVNYGFNFDVVVQSGNIWGTQFHPEKSQKCGLQILKNFAAL